MADSYDLIIVGGGPAGLAHAFWRRLARPDLRILIAEARPRPGGWAHTERRDGFVCELGPQGFRPNRDSDVFVEALGLGGRVVAAEPTAVDRWLGVGGRLHALPRSLGGLVGTRVLSFCGKLRLLREPWVRTRGPADESVADFVGRRFGQQTRCLAEALVHGVFAGDADRLEMRAAFPAAVEAEEAHGSVLRGLRAARHNNGAKNGGGEPRKRPVLCTFAGGMQESVDRLVERLGDALRLEAPVESLRRDDGGYRVELGGAQPQVACAPEVAIAAPAATAARLVDGFAPERGAELGAIDYASVASVYVGIRREDFARPPRGFGFLLPKGEGDPVLGVLYSSIVFPHQAPAGHVLLRVMSGGVEAPAEIERGDQDLRAQARTALERYLDLRREPVFTHVTRARRGIPSYDRGHAARLQRIRPLVERQPGLSLLGASYRQVSVVAQWSREGSRP